MPKTCKECLTTKEFTEFDKVDGSRKYEPVCRQCKAVGVATAVGLNPEPDVVKKPKIDAERQQRIDRYNMLRRRSQS